MKSARGLCPISFAMLLLAIAPMVARADVALDVELGWSGQQRWGTWTPLFLTVSAAGPRALLVQVFAPHGAGLGIQVETQVTASRTPAVYPLFIPMTLSHQDLMVVARDAETGQRLADWPSWEKRASMSPNPPVDALIGTSGVAPTMRSCPAEAQVVYIEPVKLPMHALGYDSLSALVLNQPDLIRMPLEQQQAIVDWVAAGGTLILWPGPDPLPVASPLVSALPVTIGDNTIVQIDPELLEQAGLPHRFQQMKGRVMSPRSGATTVPLFGAGGPNFYRGELGLGQVIVLPVDPTFFVFTGVETAARFWRPLLKGVVEIPESSSDSAAPQYWNPAMQRRANAFSQVADRLGDVPGIGRFGFGYIAAVLIGLMIVVGPVDWLVLKLLGRHPWTWFTTTGWIVLVTTGAIFIGHIFRSGDLHYRSLRIVDQVDGAAVATTDLACVYSPRTARYTLETAREGWWQPGAAHNWGSRETGIHVPFEQDARGNRPAPMIINVWSLRFLQGDAIAPGPAIVETALSLRRTPDGMRYAGWIKNVSARPLQNVVIRSQPRSPGMAGLLDQTQVWYSSGPELQRIEPGESVVVDLPVAQHRLPRSPYYTGDLLWLQAHDLAVERAQHVERKLSASDRYACVYAEVENPAPSATLRGEEPIERHWQVVRALVRVDPPQEQQP